MILALNHYYCCLCLCSLSFLFAATITMKNVLVIRIEIVPMIAVTIVITVGIVHHQNVILACSFSCHYSASSSSSSSSGHPSSFRSSQPPYYSCLLCLAALPISVLASLPGLVVVFMVFSSLGRAIEGSQLRLPSAAPLAGARRAEAWAPSSFQHGMSSQRLV